MAEGYVCLWRSAIESEFFDDEWLCKLWMWCMCRANYKEQEWKGEVIPAGSFITGRHAASSALRVTESKFYRGLKRLENMRMIVTKSNNRFTVVTLCNWKTYQQPDSDKRTTDEQPANNKRTTSEQPANTGEEGNKGIRKESNTGFVPPTVEEVSAYCAERRNSVDPEAFFAHYDANGWMIGKTKMKKWKSAIVTWEKNNFQKSQPANPAAVRCKPASLEDLENYRP